jgi:hypothetical protein
MHQLKKVKNNFKWVSAFHTLLMSMVNTRNLDHWRFQVSEIWDQIRGFDSDISGEIPWRNFYGTAEVYIKNLGFRYWGVEEIPDLPPELGGVAIGNTFRTDYSLKGSLILLEKMDTCTYIDKWRYLYVTKEMFSFVPKFRPWVKMPHGKTRDRMLSIGQYSGLHHELESFSLKAQNKFVLDSNWYKCEFWDLYSEKLKNKLATDSIKTDFWEWAQSKEWPTFAIPRKFVGEQIVLPSDQRVLPFVRIQKSKPKYSLPTMMVSFIDSFVNKSLLTEVPRSEIDFSTYLQWEAPVYCDSNRYKPVCNMETISKVAAFSDPRRTYLDYWYRNNSVITELLTEDNRSKASLDLLFSIDPTLKDQGYDKATWYTTYPMPYKSDWINILSNNLPDQHATIIMHLINHPEDLIDPVGAWILMEELDRHRKENKKFWKEKTRSKVSSQKKRIAQLGARAPAQTMTEEEPLTLLNMDDIRRVLDDLSEKFQGITKQTQQVNEPVKFEPPILDLPEEPDWYNFVEPVEDQDYELDVEADEDYLLSHINLDDHIYGRQDWLPEGD